MAPALLPRPFAPLLDGPLTAHGLQLAGINEEVSLASSLHVPGLHHMQLPMEAAYGQARVADTWENGSQRVGLVSATPSCERLPVQGGVSGSGLAKVLWSWSEDSAGQRHTEA